MFNQTGYSLADIAAATGGARGADGFGDGFMNNGAWWIIILFLFAFNGNGLWGGGAQGGTLKEEIGYGFDMNGLENGIRGIQQGLCDGFYAQNTSLLTGFNNLGNLITGGNATLQNALCQGFNGIQAQLANDALVAQQCCCETRNLIGSKFSDLNYNLATQASDTRRAIADSTRDIIDSQQAGTRAVLDFLTQDKIATLTAENQALKFAASQANQNVALGAMMDANTAEILRRTAPLPIPAYVVPNPNCCYPNYNYNYGGC